MLYSFIIRRAVESDAARIFTILQQAFQEYGNTLGRLALKPFRNQLMTSGGRLPKKRF